MAAPTPPPTTPYQLGPTSSFTEPQRRELNAILLRISTDVAKAAVGQVISGGIVDRPDPGTLNRLYVQDDAAGPHVFLDTGVFWYTVL